MAQATAWEILDYHWSPDSQWIAYTKPEERQMPRIYLYSLAANKSWPATDGWFASGSPTFSADGKYLFFISDRSFQPSYGRVEENYTYFDMGRIHFVTLAKDTKSPVAPNSDEVGIGKAVPARPDPASGGGIEALRTRFLAAAQAGGRDGRYRWAGLADRRAASRTVGLSSLDLRRRPPVLLAPRPPRCQGPLDGL